MFQINQDCVENIFSLLRSIFGGCDTKPSPMQVCSGIRIISMTRLDNLGAILCPITSTKFLDSGETEMREDFVCSQAVTYASVEEAIREAQLEKGELVSHVEEEKRTQESPTLMDPHTVEYISGWIEKKVCFFLKHRLNISFYCHFRLVVKECSLCPVGSRMG